MPIACIVLVRQVPVTLQSSKQNQFEWPSPREDFPGLRRRRDIGRGDLRAHGRAPGGAPSAPWHPESDGFVTGYIKVWMGSSSETVATKGTSL